mgnify:CR=1 FL=1
MKKGLGLGGAMGLVVALVLFGIIAMVFFGPQLSDFLKTTKETAPTPWTPEEKEEPEVVVNCPDDGTTTIKALARNPLNSSLEYTGAKLYYVVNNRQVASATLNSGGAGTAYKEIYANALCGKERFYLMTIDDSNHVYFKAGPFLAEGPIMNLGPEDGLEIPESTDLKFTVYDDVWNELTNSTLSPQQDVATVTAVSIDTSTNKKVAVIRVTTSSSAAQFGSDLAKPYVCADFDLSYYSKTGIILQGGGAVEVSDLPRYCANNAYEKAWQINPVKALTDFDLIVQDVLQDPGTSQDIKLIFVDQHAYEKTDGTIAVGTADDLSNDVGETNRYITISVS